MKTVPFPIVWANQGLLLLTSLSSVIFGNYIGMVLPLFVGIASLRTGENPLEQLFRPFIRKKGRLYRQTDFLQHQWSQWIAVGGSGTALFAAFSSRLEWLAPLTASSLALWAVLSVYMTYMTRTTQKAPGDSQGQECSE